MFAVGSRASWRNLTVNVVRSLDRSVTRLLFDIAERHAQGFPVPESALTVMAMTSGAAAASADLDSLYRDLRAAHLHPLWRIERNLLTEHPMPRAIRGCGGRPTCTRSASGRSARFR